MTNRTRQADGPPDASIEPRLARTLRVGTYVSVGAVGLGTILLVLGGTSPTSGGPPLVPSQVIDDIVALRPAGFLWLGMLGILATPALRVAHATAALARAGEPRMAVVGLLVLGVIAAGVIVGVVAA